MVSKRLSASERALEHQVVDLAEHVRLDRVVVPGAEHDADRALGRQIAPVAPHPRPRPLLVGRRAVGAGVEMARIQPLVELLDRLALAGAVDAGDHDDHGEIASLDQIELRVQQRLAELRLLRLVGLLVESVRQRRRFEHRGSIA
jgi:hypothetical protein